MNLSKKSLILTVVLLQCFIYSSSLAMDYNFFIKEVSSSCPLASQLLLKKTFLSFVRTQSACENTFVKRLLMTCSSLSCEELTKVFIAASEKESGNIIGGSY